MISFFRRGLSSWFVVAFLALIALAFIVTGVGTPSGLGALGGGDTIAEVNGERITATEVADQINRQLANARQQQPDLTMAQFLEGGTLERIVDQMITARAVTAFGREQGLTASQTQIDTEIASLPAFHNLAGQFDQATFQRALQQQNVTEDQLRQDLAASLIERQLMLPVGAAARLPRDIALQYASLLLEQRSGSVGGIALESIPEGPAPTAAEVNAFFTRNQARYTIPERRVIRYAQFGADKVAQAAQPTDAEIAAFYNSNRDAYGARETRSFSQIVLPDQAAARAFAQKLAAGTSFAAAAQQAGFSASDTSIGEQTRESLSRLTNAAIANAAFTAAEGATTQPAQSELGWHILRVDDVTTTAARPLAAVRGEIEEQLRRQKTEEAMAALATRIEDSIADGATFEEVVRAEGLQAQQTVPITATGQAPGNPDYQPPEAVKPLIEPAFDMAADDDPVLQASPDNQTYSLIALGEVVQAAPPPLQQIRDRVAADLRAERANARAKQIAEQIAAKINAGMTPQEAFRTAGIPVEGPRPISARRLEIAQQGQQVPPAVALMFSIPEGKARAFPAPSGIGWFVVHLDEVVPGDASGQPELVEATRQQFSQALGNEYSMQFANAAQGSLKVERHDAAIERLKAQLLGRGNP